MTPEGKALVVLLVGSLCAWVCVLMQRHLDRADEYRWPDCDEDDELDENDSDNTGADRP